MSDPETRMMTCFKCHGEGGWEGVGNHWRQCADCNGSGETEVEVQPITLDDLEGME